MTPNPTPAVHSSAIDTLAQETELPREVVAELYEEELSQLAPQASISQFLPLIVSRRVLSRLQHDVRN